MRVVLSIGISSATVMAATVATAQPVAAPAACAVTIARAPDDVRDEVTRWVRAEPHCNATLEVRVVPTEGGLYLFARDGRGRVRERVVPDAQSVGVLVASWVADDSIETPPSTPGAADPGASSAIAIAGEPDGAHRGPSDPTTSWRLIMPPGKTPALGPWIEREPAPRLATAPTSWLTLGGTVQVGADDSLGVRAELDLYTHDGWSFAAALAAGTSDFVGFSDTGNEFSVHTREARAVAMVTHTWSFRGWQLRLGGGVGAKYTTFTSVELFGQSDPTGDGAKLIAPTFEVSGLLAYTFDSGWAIGVGPVVTWYAEAGTAGRSNLELVRADLELMTFAGIRHRL